MYSLLLEHTYTRHEFRLQRKSQLCWLTSKFHMINEALVLNVDHAVVPVGECSVLARMTKHAWSRYSTE
jgi:hypothetical protein